MFIFVITNVPFEANYRAFSFSTRQLTDVVAKLAYISLLLVYYMPVYVCVDGHCNDLYPRHI